MTRRLCVFLGSSHGSDPSHARTAARLGGMLAERGIGLVFGGGRVGLMGEVAHAALAAGGEVIGVIPSAMVEREWAHRGVTQLRVTADMHERKALMSQLADAFLALPGGIGTLEELFEVYTWAQLGFHHKPVGLLDHDGYYQPLLNMLDRMCDQGFVDRGTRQLLSAEPTLDRILVRLGMDE